MQRPTKDDAQQPIPEAWRDPLREVVKALAAGDYRLAQGVAGVDPVSASTAKQMREYILDYGETLVLLPEETWTTSVAHWYAPHWAFLVDLWTAESGPSDMVLSGKVVESGDAYRFTLDLVYVP